MKYIIILGDGMADEPLAQLDHRTPLEYAHTPAMDSLSQLSEIGLVHTIPEGMSPGSDTANLSVLGYDPRKYYSGRSPLEALSIGVDMKAEDIAIRCNVVTISEDDVPFEEKTIIDHSSSEISTEDCAVLLQAAAGVLAEDGYQFHVGTSYRHCLIWNGGSVVPLTPPHDVLGQKIGAYLPADEKLREMMKKSYDILTGHPINIERKRQGLNPANCCWFWGAGTKPMLDSFQEKTGKRGMMVSAVDLLKGIAVGSGMGSAEVPGANGGLHTNYAGKVDAALQALLQEGYDFAYIHVEAPDEMGHQGSAERKIQAIEYLDELVIAPVKQRMDESGEPYRLLVLPDHPTPVSLRTHTSEAVPYMLYDSRSQGKMPSGDGDKKCDSWHYNEREAKESGRYIEQGHTLIDMFLELSQEESSYV